MEIKNIHSSSQPFNFAITLNTCWCCCQQTVPSNIGTAVLVNRPGRREAGVLLSPGFGRPSRFTACSTPAPGGDVESCFAPISGVFNLRGGDNHDWSSIIEEHRLTCPPQIQFSVSDLGVDSTTPSLPAIRWASRIPDAPDHLSQRVPMVPIPESLVSVN